MADPNVPHAQITWDDKPLRERTAGELGLCGPREHCEHCGGSGILNIVATGDGRVWFEDRYASPCHACPAGEVWKEVGLE